MKCSQGTPLYGAHLECLFQNLEECPLQICSGTLSSVLLLDGSWARSLADFLKDDVSISDGN